MITKRNAKLIADYCVNPALEAMLLDDKLAYFAMHEAEKMLFKFGPKDSDSIVANRMHDYAEALGYDIHATAEQRAEALLKTIGRWEDESEQV